MRVTQWIPQHLVQRTSRVIAGIGLSLAVSACGLSDLLNGDDPPEGGVVHPNAVTTYEGAVGVYSSAIYGMTEAMSYVSLDVGILTDELSGGGPSNIYIDARTKSSDADEGLASTAYGNLQTARIRSAQASELLLRYGNESSRAMVGHAYALQAQAIMILAELHCSGVPLTEVPFERDLQFTPGLSTTTLFERAIALFDTAITYGNDSIPIATLARVGKGRALLNLGKYVEAAEAVADVRNDDKYTVTFTAAVGGIAFWQRPTEFSVLNQEGGNGIPWSLRPAPQDTRVPLSGTTTLRQQKYATQAATVPIAGGIG